MKIRRFNQEDAETIAYILKRNFLEINIKDYPKEMMDKLVEEYNVESIINRAKDAHTYVLEKDNQVIATATISPYWGSKKESIILSVFTNPDYHGLGYGRKLIETIEKDEYFLRADRIEIPASITAVNFYRKLGYDYKANIKTPDKSGHISLEKFK